MIDKQAIIAIGRLTLQRNECLKQPRLWGPAVCNLFVCLIPCALAKGQDPVLLARTFAPLASRRAREIRESLYIPLGADVIGRGSRTPGE
jgi:hypothetical protein